MLTETTNSVVMWATNFQPDTKDCFVRISLKLSAVFVRKEIPSRLKAPIRGGGGREKKYRPCIFL